MNFSIAFNQEQLEKLIKGFDRLGKEKLIEIDENAIRILFQTKEANPEVDWQRFLKNFNAAIEILNISVENVICSNIADINRRRF